MAGSGVQYNRYFKISKTTLSVLNKTVANTTNPDQTVLVAIFRDVIVPWKRIFPWILGPIRRKWGGGGHRNQSSYFFNLPPKIPKL